jgi:exodeoxyribonuclease V gamma subunit
MSVMVGLKIFTSNRLEVLVEKLAQIIKKPLLSPLAPEVIVVQSRGMERWVSMELAQHNGICANCDFPFPNDFLQQLFQKMIPDLPQDSPFEPAAMTFKLMKILPRLLNRPDFKNLNTYLKDDTNKLKLFQLSNKIADTFDQYLVFRPEMIFSWEAGSTDDLHENRWQAYLWRELVRGKEKLHRAWLRKTLFEKISNISLDRTGFPQRVSVFGISYLPPFYLQTFATISRLIRVNLFVLNPCLEYWSDIVSDREMRKIKGRYSQKELMTDDLHLEKGNRLLASMGVLGRDFMTLISEFDSQISEQFEDQDCKTVLACVQSDIFHLRDREKVDDQGTVVKPTLNSSLENQPQSHHQLEADTSIQIHSCHSPMREMEVLYDHLLAMFDEDPDLLPKDIIVMTPDIETYAPYAQIVFGAPKEDFLKIPYSIADQSIKKDSRFIEGFLSILDLKTSRFGADQVLGFLEMPGIREKFGLSESEIEKVEHWIREINIRWGIDASSRSQLGLPGFTENTWKSGIQRFLLGYAMPGDEESLFKGILPYGKIEGADVKALGKFLNFLERIFSCRDNLEKPRPLSKWHTTLLAILDQFFLPDEETEPEIQFIRGVLDDLSHLEVLSGYEDKIELDVIQSYLGNQFDKNSFGYGFLKGGITFCAMLPMRSIPFKVICLIGMNSETFPRDVKAVGFDLIAKHSMAGDRSRRNDDKYLFLEAIISARKKLYLSYVGQNIQDNTRIPPSILVSELIDTLKEGFGASEDQLVVYHRLQSFNPAYFQQDTQLFSYSRENLIAAAHLNRHKEPQPFIATALSTPGDEWKHIAIKSLCDFYANPVKYLLQQRLGIFLDEETPVIDDRENFRLDGLQKYQIGQDLVKRRLSGSNLTDDLSIQTAKGVLPHGNVGRVFYNEMSHEADFFIRKVEKFTGNQPADDMDIDLEIENFNLTGMLTGIHHHSLIRIRYANKKAKDLISAWIQHLVMCCLINDSGSRKTTLLCKDSTWEFQPVEASGKILENLVSLFWLGISKPVHFFPESSLEYARQLIIKKKSLDAALKAINTKWVGNEFKRGESEDPYFKLCFRYMNPLDDDFQKLAEKVFSPLLSHCAEVIE